MFKVADAGMTS